MSWADVHRAIFRKRALDAAASTTIIPNQMPEIDPEAVEAYLSASRAELQRHATRSAFSAIQTVMQATTPATNPMRDGEAVEKVVQRLAVKLLSKGMGWFAIAFLLWTLVDVVHWGEWAEEIEAWLQIIGPNISAIVVRIITFLLTLPVLLVGVIVRAIARSDVAIFAGNAIRESYFRTKDFIERKYIDFRYNSVRDAVFLRYQLVFNWLGNHKAHLAASFVFIWFVSSIIENKKSISTDTFMEWTELQRYINQPIPEILFRRPKEFGSNSHYYRDAGMTSGVLSCVC